MFDVFNDDEIANHNIHRTDRNAQSTLRLVGKPVGKSVLQSLSRVIDARPRGKSFNYAITRNSSCTHLCAENQTLNKHTS